MKIGSVSTPKQILGRLAPTHAGGNPLAEQSITHLSCSSSRFRFMVWAGTQFGTSAFDVAVAVAVDATGVYIFGATRGVFAGEIGAGGADAFVAKLDSAGSVVWVRQFGTPDDDLFTRIGGIAVDGTGVYLAGTTLDTLPDQASAGAR